MHSQRSPQIDTPELVVHDEAESCPYLPAETARLPLRYRPRAYSPTEFDQRMALGQRRSGPFLYQPACPSCRACQAIRLEVARFDYTRTQKRVWRRGQQELTTEITRPTFDQQRLDLFNQHRLERGLGRHEGPVDAEGYRMFLVESCCDTWEIDYRADGQLVGVAICDRGAESLSAVYCYYDPRQAHLSLGVFSVLMHLELCRRWQLKYLYLGYYIAACSHMNYKQGYKPHERLIAGVWQPFERD